MSPVRARLPIFLAWIAVLGLAWLAYLPGLAGGFLFDDFVNLDAIGRNGRIDDGAALLRYLTSGTADPLGRPVALLSFLLDARQWPADPAPFLRTNLLLHLFNGGLLFLLLRRLDARLRPLAGWRREAVPLLAAAAWLLHPLFVSTTLYIVQRESMLAATFSLAGLFGWQVGRGWVERGASGRGLALMAVSVVAGTGLAALSKANGLLLPLLLLMVEWILPTRLDDATAQAKARFRLTRVFLLWLPAAAILAYVAWHALAWRHYLPDRGWTVGQRLLTEPRVLAGYLVLLLVPRAMSSGLYNDHIVASTGLLNPMGTLPALLLVALLATLVWKSRCTRPALALGVGFFLAGHLLESSSVPLELYFEHRNYLPAALLAWPLARALFTHLARTGVAVSGAVLIVALLAATTYARASAWGDPQLLAMAWARLSPDSARAQADAALSLTATDRPREALALLAAARARHPGDIQLLVNAVDAQCLIGPLGTTNINHVAVELRRLPTGNQLASRWLAKYVVAGPPCPGLSLDAVGAWIASLEANPVANQGGEARRLALLRARWFLLRGEPSAATARLAAADVVAPPQPEDTLREVALLSSSGHDARALAHLRSHPPRPTVAPLGMRAIHAAILRRQGYWEREYAWMEDTLRARLGSARP